MDKKSIRSSLLLLLAALIWGAAFVAQRMGMEHIEPFTFISLRSLMAAAVLLPVIRVFDRRRGAAPAKGNPAVWPVGMLCGAVLFVASALQQFGILYTSVGKAGFITALYIVLVPLLGVFVKKKVSILLWVSVAVATAGMYLLTMTGGLGIGLGDLLVLLCALVFAVHILLIDRFCAALDSIRFACIQFFTCGVLAALPMALWEQPAFTAIVAAAAPLVYSGVLSSGVAHTLQIVAQKELDPTVASLIMCLESVFAALAGWLILGEGLSPRELAGCALVFGAMVLAQLPRHRGPALRLE